MMRFLKKHTWILAAFFAIVMFPPALSLQGKLDGRLIITGLAIDKLGEKYLVTAQTVSPSSGAIAQGENAGIDFVTVESETVRAGVLEIATKVGKTPGLAHLNFIVLGSSMFSEDIANALDFIVREAHTDTSILLLTAENGSEEIKKTKELEMGTAVTMRKNYLSKQKQSNGVLMVTNEFISNKYNPSKSSIVNFLEIVMEEPPESEKSSGSGGPSSAESSSGNGSSEQGGGSGESSGSSGGGTNNTSPMTKQGRIKYLSPLALFSNGYYKGKLETKQEIMGYQFANTHSKEITYGFAPITTPDLGEAKITLQAKKKKSKIKCKIENGKPMVEISVTLDDNQVLEIVSSTSDNRNIYHTQENYLTQEMRDQMAKEIEEAVTATFESAREKQVDLFNTCNRLEQYHKKQFDKYFENHTLEDFLKDVQLKVKAKVGKAQA